MKDKIILGYVPTRRNVFSKEEAGRFKEIIKKRLKDFDAEFIDIDDINEEGLLVTEIDAYKTVEKLRVNKVDGIFFPHCNFGTEFLVGRVASEIEVPVLLWGPTDDAPGKDGVRSRDTQCGLFASGKALRRFGVPFTYLTNCRLDEKKFENGMSMFIQVCRVVKAFRDLKILQIAPRPAPFWSVIVNEGELLEKFGIEVKPITLSELKNRMMEYLDGEKQELLSAQAIVKGVSADGIEEMEIRKMAALKCAMKSYCKELNCRAVAVQCWDAMQEELEIMPCYANGVLSDEGIPVACETDIHGAITSVMLQSILDDTVFMADMTTRHPTNENGELLWHCGNFPLSLAKDRGRAHVGRHVILPGKCPGTGEFCLKDGEITVCRFDGDHGEYSLFIGEGKTVEGPATTGTYVWIEVPDMDAWEQRLVTGPYIHHCSAGYGHVAHILYEACKYIPGLSPDLASPGREEIEKELLKHNRRA